MSLVVNIETSLEREVGELERRVQCLGDGALVHGLKSKMSSVNLAFYFWKESRQCDLKLIFLNECIRQLRAALAHHSIREALLKG